ncbi:hypothetical protein [Variovorax ginsengisoli]|uniref:Metal-binding protein n=1 Tax=Variovorax ginsengisoli TaxID=363844 RepID=A0ABT9S4G7_9BURK|nr:hypothetical protein [Variovorax ginsengisoli]MDP9899243.1 putative metal-binding protein [Variovorax ginsengisoli]
MTDNVLLPARPVADPATDRPAATPATPGKEKAPFVKTRYTGAVLICKQCQKRSSGPAKLKAKDLQQPFKRALGGARLRLRIVQTTCLGLCPKKAIAVAAFAADGPSLLAAVRDEEEVAPIAGRLLGRAAD